MLMAAKITPGFIYPSEAEALTQAMATIDQQGQRIATGRESNEERFFLPVSITAYDSGTGYYSWTEQTYSASGVRITRPGGLTGTHTFNPLRLLGDTVLTTFPVEGLIVRAIGTTTKGVVYEGVTVSLSDIEEINLDYIAKLCVTRRSGVVTNITAEHRTIRILGKVLTDQTVCTTGDTDCCPDIWLDCATERELSVESLPSSLVLRIRGHGDAGCTAIDVCFPLIATNDPSIKYHDHPCWVAYIDDLPGVAPGTFVTLNYYPCSSPYPPVMGAGWLPADTYFWWQWRNGGNLSPDDGYCNLGTHDTGGTTLHAFASVNDTEAYAPLALVSEGVAFGALGVASGCCDSVDGTNYLTLEAYDTDADCVSGGGDPGTDGCCADASDLAMFLDSTGSFDSLADSYTLVYDPTEIDDQLNGDAAWADQFQWYVELHDGTILYFGCAGGTHYVGIKAGSPIYDCFDTMTAHTLFKVQTVVAAVSCTESTYVTTALTADGGTGCVGDFNLTIYR